jgi:hypothetical protein
LSEAFLSKKEFESLSEDFKWEYVDGLIKSMKKLQIKADKNCEECESEMLAMDDINIDLLFEDWRECAEHCDKCGKEEKVNMCNTQFELINLLANSLAELRSRQNGIANLVLKKDERGSKLLKKQEEDIEQAKKQTAGLFS